MDFVRRSFWLCFALIAPAILLGQSSSTPVTGPDPISDAAELLALANETREAAGMGPLQWDAALSDAAMKHCLRMTAEVPIAHQYDGEPDLTTRAATAGAHFSTIEENLAVARSAEIIHKAWLDSPGHRKNLLNPSVDRVGIAVITYQGLLYAVADYARAVPVLTEAQVEAAFANLLRSRNLMISQGSMQARAYCASSGNYEGGRLSQICHALAKSRCDAIAGRIGSSTGERRLSEGRGGQLPAQDVNGSLTIYRVAVLLY